MSPFHVIIPARYASQRFPGKVLERIAGKSLIEHVFRAARAAGAAGACIATDDERVAEEARAFGAPAIMTGDHESGSDRIAEASALLGLSESEIIVNVQGDEPGVPPSAIRRVAELLDEDEAPMSTLATPIGALDELMSAHVVKVVRDAAGRALYFSRAPIPWPRDAFASVERHLPEGGGYLRHIGIYGYRHRFLRQMTRTPRCRAEELESLEQLRALHVGGAIRVGVFHGAIPPGVDVPEDLERAASAMQATGHAKKVLFVCMGNICRSPTAQGVAEKRVAERNLSLQIEVDSAGTHAYHVGEAPDPRAVEAARRRGVDLTGQRARGIDPKDYRDFDHILVMDRQNLDRVRANAPEDSTARVARILDFAGLRGIHDVPDPYYGGRHGFEQVLDLLENAMDAALDHILADE